MSFDSDKWRKFQDEALSSIIFEADPKSIFSIKIINSFSPSINWRIVRKTQNIEEFYFAEFRRWRSDIDQEKFRSPVELLKYLNSLTPTIEQGQIQIESEFIENILERFYSIKIQPFVNLQNFGVDGSTIEIKFGGSFQNSKFSWWNNPPEQWKQLGNVVADVLNYLDLKLTV